MLWNPFAKKPNNTNEYNEKDMKMVVSKNGNIKFLPRGYGMNQGDRTITEEERNQYNKNYRNNTLTNKKPKIKMTNKKINIKLRRRREMSDLKEMMLGGKRTKNRKSRKTRKY